MLREGDTVIVPQRKKQHKKPLAAFWQHYFMRDKLKAPEAACLTTHLRVCAHRLLKPPAKPLCTGSMKILCLGYVPCPENDSIKQDG